jgi:hypothetical protein
MTDLSPAAQVVLDAADAFSCPGPDDCLNDVSKVVAAALRAAADQVVPQALCVYNSESISIRSQLLAIASELEAQ